MLIHKTKEFNKVINILDQFCDDLEYVVAGGYPRDLDHDTAPKDLDIIVLCEESYLNDVISEFKSQGIVEQLFTKEQNKDEFGQDEYEDNRVVCVIKVEGGIDIIFWSDTIFLQCRDVILEGFDYNINQYILDDNFNPEFIGKGERELHIVRGAFISDQRHRKMIRKAKCLGWNVKCV